MKPKKIVIISLCLIAFMEGVLDNLSEGSGQTFRILAHFIPTFIGLALIFLWLHFDEKQINYKPSPLLNIGIAGFGLFFIPLYLYKSRRMGSRFRSIFCFFGYCLLWVGLSTLGEDVAKHIFT